MHRKVRGFCFLYRRKTDDKDVNIFRKRIYCVTVLLSMLCKTYCLALQKRRFCTVKVALLPSKRAAFAMPNRNCRFLYELFLQSQDCFLGFILVILENLGELYFLDDNAFYSLPSAQQITLCPAFSYGFGLSLCRRYKARRSLPTCL